MSPLIEPGTYRIQIGEHSDQALFTIKESQDPSDPSKIHAQTRAAEDIPTQEFILDHTADSDTYTCQNVANGLYIVPDYPSINHDSIRLSSKAYQWDIFSEPGVPGGVFRFRLPNTNTTIHLAENSSESGYTVYLHASFPAPTVGENCRFDPVGTARTPIVRPAPVSPGTLRSGRYRIRSLTTKNLLAFEKTHDPTHTDNYHDICAVCQHEFEKDPYQEWDVLYIPLSKTYYIQNVATKKYFTTEVPSDNNRKLIPSSRPQHWDIRQAEFDTPAKGLYRLHLPESKQAMGLYFSIPISGQYVTIWEIPFPCYPQQRWIFEPADVPSGADNIGRPLVQIPPLISGVYKIRNVGSNKYMTLLASAKGPNIEDGPHIVTLPSGKGIDELYQQWIVTYVSATETFLIENVKNGLYTNSMWEENGGYILQGGAKPQSWDIRQFEYDGQPDTQLIIQMPATKWTFEVAGNDEAEIGLRTRSGVPTSLLQRFVFEVVDNPQRTAVTTE